MIKILEASSFENETSIALHSRAGVSPDLSIHDACMASGPAEGVSFDGSIVRISESLCANLASGDIKNILVKYSVVGRYGVKIPKIAVFNLSRTIDGPVISSHIVCNPFSSNGMVCFDLLSDYAS